MFMNLNAHVHMYAIPCMWVFPILQYTLLPHTCLLQYLTSDVILTTSPNYYIYRSMHTTQQSATCIYTACVLYTHKHNTYVDSLIVNFK